MSKETASQSFLQYPHVEHNSYPEKKMYDDYWRIGYQAEITGRPNKENGIKGLWKLHELPYMRDIFGQKMQCTPSQML